MMYHYELSYIATCFDKSAFELFVISLFVYIFFYFWFFATSNVLMSYTLLMLFKQEVHPAQGAVEEESPTEKSEVRVILRSYL